jgi:hypothetical protein
MDDDVVLRRAEHLDAAHALEDADSVIEVDDRLAFLYLLQVAEHRLDLPDALAEKPFLAADVRLAENQDSVARVGLQLETAFDSAADDRHRTCGHAAGKIGITPGRTVRVSSRAFSQAPRVPRAGKASSGRRR